MRVTLTQDELFEAISDHLRGKLNLDDTASIEISFTAGRSPKGYTADVDITYPKSALAAKITAKPHDDEAGAADGSATTGALVGVVADSTVAAIVNPTNLFGT